MRLTNRDNLTFGQIADEWAREPGSLGRDDILYELMRAVWRGDFEDEDGTNSCLTIHRPPLGGAVRIDGKFVDKHHTRTAETKPVGFNRRMLLCALAGDRPSGLPLPPGDRLRFWINPKSDNPEPVAWSELKAEIRWDILDALTPNEYSQTFRERYFEALSISKPDFGQWCKAHGHQRPVFWWAKLDDCLAASTGTPDAHPAGARAEGADLGKLQDAAAPVPAQDAAANCGTKTKRPRPVSDAKLEAWYRSRIEDFEDEDPPIDLADWTVAKQKFGPRVTRERVRKLRRRIAPAHWNVTKPGPKSRASKD